MKIFCENKLTIPECRENLKEKYGQNSNIKFFKEIDWDNAFYFFLLSILGSGVISIFEGLFIKSNLYIIAISFIFFILLFTGFFIYIDTKISIDEKRKELNKTKLAYETDNDEEFLKFLCIYYFTEYNRIVLSLLEKNEVKILNHQYSEEVNRLWITYDKNGLVYEDNFYVSNYELRTDITEDELVLNNHNQIIYKQVYNKENK